MCVILVHVEKSKNSVFKGDTQKTTLQEEGAVNKNAFLEGHVKQITDLFRLIL